MNLNTNPARCYRALFDADGYLVRCHKTTQPLAHSVEEWDGSAVWRLLTEAEMRDAVRRLWVAPAGHGTTP